VVSSFSQLKMDEELKGIQERTAINRSVWTMVVGLLAQCMSPGKRKAFIVEEVFSDGADKLFYLINGRTYQYSSFTIERQFLAARSYTVFLCRFLPRVVM